MGQIINIYWDIATDPSEISLLADYRAGQTPTATEMNTFLNSLITQGNLNSDWLLELTIKIPGVVDAIDAVLVAYNTHSDELDATMLALTDLVHTFTEDSSEFDTWFSLIKDQLSTDAAGNLQMQVDACVLVDEGLQTSIDGIQEVLGNSIYIGGPGDVTPPIPANADTLGGQLPAYYTKESDLVLLKTLLAGTKVEFTPVIGVKAADSCYYKLNTVTKKVSFSFNISGLSFGAGIGAVIFTLPANIVPLEQQRSTITTYGAGGLATGYINVDAISRAISVTPILSATNVWGKFDIDIE